jgi:hypothetical protein
MEARRYRPEEGNAKLAGEARVDTSMEMMRYFNGRWRDGELSDAEFDDVVTAYQEHLEAIAPKLPARLRELVKVVSLHDARVRRATLTAKSFVLLLRAGDLQRGYCDVTLRYSDIASLVAQPSPSGVFEREDAEIIQDEIDIVGTTGQLEHRFLFAPEGEFVVRFRNFEYETTATHSRAFKRQRPVFTTD